MTIRRELIDELLKDYEHPQDILGEGGLLKELTKAVIERCLETVFFPLMKRSTKWSIWRCATLPGSGRCLSVTGNQHSIALRWNSPSGFPDEQQLVTQCGSKSRQLAAHETTHAKKRVHVRLHT